MSQRPGALKWYGPDGLTDPTPADLLPLLQDLGAEIVKYVDSGKRDDFDGVLRPKGDFPYGESFLVIPLTPLTQPLET